MINLEKLNAVGQRVNTKNRKRRHFNAHVHIRSPLHIICYIIAYASLIFLFNISSEKYVCHQKNCSYSLNPLYIMNIQTIFY